MEERRWEDLEMDCLVNVLGRVGMETLLLDVPFVCTSWHKATLNPLCWKCLEFPHAFDSHSYPSFIQKFKDIYKIQQLSDTAFIKFMVDRSCENATKLVLPITCTEEALKHATEKCPSLEILGLPLDLFRNQLSIIPEMIGKWKNLEGLIIGIDTFFRDHELGLRCTRANIGEEESSAIVTLLPKIKYLDISWALIDRESLIMILQRCKELTYLDASNCQSVEIDDEILELASHITTLNYQGSTAHVPWSRFSDLEGIRVIDMLYDESYFDDSYFDDLLDDII